MASNTVIDAINAGASNARVRLAMLMGSKLESGWNPSAVGDGGTSYGIFQIHLPAHPGVTADQAKDPTFAVHFMAGAYEAGVNRVDAALWNSDPALAAATAAFYAERPKVMYPTDRVRAAWSPVNTAWGGGDVGADATNANFANPVADAVDNMWKSIWWQAYDAFGTVVDKVYFGILIGGGAITIGVGFYLLLHESNKITNAVRQTAGAYAMFGRTGASAIRHVARK